MRVLKGLGKHGYSREYLERKMAEKYEEGRESMMPRIQKSERLASSYLAEMKHYKQSRDEWKMKAQGNWNGR